MDVIQAVVLGIVEGLTEFLPVSSTGHLIVVSQWLSVEQTATNKAFEVIIQVAAILAVIMNYKEKFTFKQWALWLKVALAFIPIGVIGLLLHQQIKALFSVPVVASMFIIGGGIFLLVEHYYQEQSSHTQEIEAMTYAQALWIGVAQVFALIPGTSRAGASIIGGLLVGLSRRASAEFSFLLALPVLAAAAGFDMVQHYETFSGQQFTVLMLGFVVSFLVAFATIKLFLRFLQRFTFTGFGIYRIIFGLILWWWF